MSLSIIPPNSAPIPQHDPTPSVPMVGMGAGGPCFHLSAPPPPWDLADAWL